MNVVYLLRCFPKCNSNCRQYRWRFPFWNSANFNFVFDCRWKPNCVSGFSISTKQFLFGWVAVVTGVCLVRLPVFMRGNERYQVATTKVASAGNTFWLGVIEFLVVTNAHLFGFPVDIAEFREKKCGKHFLQNCTCALDCIACRTIL